LNKYLKLSSSCSDTSDIRELTNEKFLEKVMIKYFNKVAEVIIIILHIIYTPHIVIMIAIIFEIKHVKIYRETINMNIIIYDIQMLIKKIF